MAAEVQVPRAFFWRRMHSLTGIWLVIYLIEHLLTNSQAALFIGDDGGGFIHMVNGIKNLPYLPFIEFFLLGVPIVIHMIWGIQYLRTGQSNSLSTDGTTPSLTEYPRNHAYSWQRITSWVLVIGLVAHVVQMRFVDHPASADREGHRYYMVRVDLDPGIYTVAARLNVQLYDQEKIELQHQIEEDFSATLAGFWLGFMDSLYSLFESPDPAEIDPDELLTEQRKLEKQEWIEALEHRPLKPGQAIAVAPDFGTAELLVVRETFKMPIMLVLYTLFVLAAVFHGFNGLWTFLITWGVSLTPRSQVATRRLAVFLMLLIGFLGLAAIWGTYWINLKQ